MTAIDEALDVLRKARDGVNSVIGVLTRFQAGLDEPDDDWMLAEAVPVTIEISDVISDLDDAARELDDVEVSLEGLKGKA